MNTTTEEQTNAAPVQPPQPMSPWYRDTAIWWGGAGVLCFSFTLPATHLAIPAFGGLVVGLGRAIIAAGLAGLVLVLRRDPLPPRQTWPGLVLVALGVVIGFPLFSALALQGTSVAHGAIITGLLPAATAIGGVVRARERPSVLFWLSCAAGTVAVLLFVIVQGAGHLQPGDGWMLAAVAAGAMGYTEGGRLARELGGWRVICWALVLAAPVLVLPVGWTLLQHGIQGNPGAWFGLGYVSVFSMFLGFFAWYRGLALGGIARIGQIQLLQPLLTIGWAALFLGESLTLATGLTALLVLLCVAVGQRNRRRDIIQNPLPESLAQTDPGLTVGAVEEE
ncbi:MAG: DMT family transporter [Ktedonobacteraceae bacterium]